MSTDIASILRKFEQLNESNVTSEAKISPAAPKLPALFKPAKISPVIGTKEKQHPMHRYFVGDDVQMDVAQTPLEEMMHDVEEDMLARVRQDLNDYLDQLAAEKHAKQELHGKAVDDVEDLNPSKPGKQHSHMPEPESAVLESPVKCIEMDSGHSCNIYGDESRGFEVGRGAKRLKTRFKTLEDAEVAVELWKGHRAQRHQDDDQDYVEER